MTCYGNLLYNWHMTQNLIKVDDLIKYATVLVDKWRAEIDHTNALDAELKARSAKTIWCRWFGMAPEGLSKDDFAWFNRWQLRRAQHMLNAARYQESNNIAYVQWDCNWGKISEFYKYFANR